MFSNDNSVTSENKSDKVTEKIITTKEVITRKEITKKEKQKIIKNNRVFVRKTAHFTLYFVLGIIIYVTLNSYGIDKRLAIYSLLFIFLYSLSDEIHQIFTQGRTFKILDIFIDTCAGFISVMISHFIKNRKCDA